MKIKKNRTLKDLTNLLGFSVGLGGTAISAYTLFKILTKGYQTWNESNLFISIPEFILSIFGVGFMGYKIIKLIKDAKK